MIRRLFCTFFILTLLDISNIKSDKGIYRTIALNFDCDRNGSSDPKIENHGQIDFLEKFPNVEFLWIENCNLTNIPRGLFRYNTKLKRLAIEFNNIDWIENQAFANFTNLTSIHASGNNLDHFNSGWFDFTTNLEYIWFRSNKIVLIPRKAFTDLRKLKWIDFSYNEISIIGPKAFEGLENLEQIKFRSNKIFLIPREAFKDLRKLKLIDFSYNEISIIEPKVFEGLEKLDFLGLDGNRLKMIQADIFPNIIQIRVLLLANNSLNFLPSRLMEKITVKFISLDFNPWKCSCLKIIYFWLYTTNATLREYCETLIIPIPICASPMSFSSSCSEYVDEQLSQRYFAAVKKLDHACVRGYYALFPIYPLT